MNYTTTIASVLGITAAGFISVWVCDRFVKRRKQTKKMSIVFDDVVNDMETAILLQTPISQKRTRARITSGMIRKWNMMAKKGMSHKQIAAEYGVSLRGMEQHLSKKVMNKTVKEVKVSIPKLVLTDFEVRCIKRPINKLNILRQLKKTIFMVRLFMNQAERLLNTVIGPATYIMAVVIVVPTVLMTITLWRVRLEATLCL